MGGVYQRQTALGHHLDQIAQAELVSKVPARAEMLIPGLSRALD